MNKARTLQALYEATKSEDKDGQKVEPTLQQGTEQATGQTPAELAALNIIRTATALTRYPMHRLTKGGAVEITLQSANEDGQTTLQWEVSHNSKYGQPGPMAYRLDTLVINRKIEEAGAPVPAVLKLGSLRDICRELGISEGENTEHVKAALRQNAGALITAKLTYKGRDKSRKLFEFDTSRYGVVFTGEQLPDERKADAVYIVFHPIYRDLLDKAETRPLDYNYLKALKSPTATRFYELVSFQIYGALESKRPRRAKYLYSAFCQEAPQTRYTQYWRMNQQMKEIHAPHLESGYILEPVEFVETADAKGQRDWEMLYTPGPKARAEHRAATRRGEGTRGEGGRGEGAKALPAAGGGEPWTPGGRKPNQQELPLAQGLLLAQGLPLAQEAPPSAPAFIPSKLIPSSAPPPDAELSAAELATLVEELVKNELNRSDAERFARERPAQCRRQLEYLPHVKEFKTSRGAYLRRAIEGDYGPPAEYAKARQQQEAVQAGQRQRARELFEANEKKARQSHQERFYGAYVDYVRERVGELEKAQPEAFMAFREGEAAQRAVLTEGPFANRPLNKKALEVFDREEIKLERYRDYCREQGFGLMEFWQWDEALNPDSFKP